MDYPLERTHLAGYLSRGDSLAERDLFFRLKSHRALRRGKWKYLRKPGNNGEPVDNLFDLTTDQHERANLDKEQPHLLDELRAKWEEIEHGLLPYPAA